MDSAKKIATGASLLLPGPPNSLVSCCVPFHHAHWFGVAAGGIPSQDILYWMCCYIYIYSILENKYVLNYTRLIWSSLFRVTIHLERCNAEAVSGSLKVQELLERDITVQRWIPKQHGFNWSNMIIISPLDCRPSENTNLQLRETGTKWIWVLLNKRV